MTIKQTAWPPLPHQHDVMDMRGLQKALYGQEGRTERPFCEFGYNGSFDIGSGLNIPAGAGFDKFNDNANMFFKAGAAGAGNTSLARVVIPFKGVWQAEFQYYVDNIANATCSGHILKNGTNVTSNSVSSAQGAGGGWSAPYTSVTRGFNAGDVLYFYMWQGSGNVGKVHGSWFGEARTKGTVRWVAALD